MIAFVFPGQGSQYVGMMRDLACQFTQVQNVFDGANRAFDKNKPGTLTDQLSDYIYPHPAFDKETHASQAEQLKQTQVAQPAIGAACLGGLNVLWSFDLDAEVFGGHSYGELVALHAAGCFDAESLARLSRERGGGRKFSKNGQ